MRGKDASPNPGVLNVRYGSLADIRPSLDFSPTLEGSERPLSGVTRVLWTLDLSVRDCSFELLRADAPEMLMPSFSIVERFDVV